MAKKSNLSTAQIEKIFKESFKDLNKKFRKELGVINIAKLIVDTIKKGISPVFGAATRFVKYSQNYIDVIQGKARFIGSKGGGSVRIEAPKSTTLKKNKAFGGTGFSAGKEKIHYFQKGMGVGKKIAPVSLHLTGEMLSTLEYDPKTGKLTASDEKWKWHNEGAGKLPVRRLLPTKPNEKFNRLIQNKITEALTKAIGLQKGRVKKFLTVKMNIK
jgi:hypothetical protein